MQRSSLHHCFYSFFMQNCLGLFFRGFLLHLLACFNILYLGYIICKNAFFLSRVWQHFNCCEFKPKSTATKLFREVIYVESYNTIGCDLYEQKCLVRFALIKKITQKNVNT